MEAFWESLSKLNHSRHTHLDRRTIIVLSASPAGRVDCQIRQPLDRMIRLILITANHGFRSYAIRCTLFELVLTFLIPVKIFYARVERKCAGNVCWECVLGMHWECAMIVGHIVRRGCPRCAKSKSFWSWWNFHFFSNQRELFLSASYDRCALFEPYSDVLPRRAYP